MNKSWQEKLSDKGKEFNLQKEEINGQIISSTSPDNRDSSGSSRDVYRVSVHKEINNKNLTKGGNKVISADAAKGDIEKLMVEAKDVTAIGAATVLVLKGILVAIKVILTTRTNTKKIMIALKVPLDEKEKKEETIEI